jgi:hypothetical protein
MELNRATVRFRVTLLVIVLGAIVAITAAAWVWHAFNQAPDLFPPPHADVRLPRA